MDELIELLRQVINPHIGCARQIQLIDNELVTDANIAIEREFDVWLDAHELITDDYPLLLDPIDVESAACWRALFRRTAPDVADLNEAITQTLWGSTLALADAEPLIAYLIARQDYDANTLGEEAQLEMALAERDERQLTMLSLDDDCWATFIIELFERLPAHPQNPPPNPQPQGPPLREALYHTTFIENLYCGQLDVAGAHYRRFAGNVRRLEEAIGEHRWHPNSFECCGPLMFPSGLMDEQEVIDLLEILPEWISNAMHRRANGALHIIDARVIPDEFIWNAPVDPQELLGGQLDACGAYAGAVSDLVEEVMHLAVLGSIINLIGTTFARQARTAPSLCFAYVFFSDAFYACANCRDCSLCHHHLMLGAANAQALQTNQLHYCLYQMSSTIWVGNFDNDGSFVSFRAWLEVAGFQQVNLAEVIEGLYQPANT